MTVGNWDLSIAGLGDAVIGYAVCLMLDHVEVQQWFTLTLTLILLHQPETTVAQPHLAAFTDYVTLTMTSPFPPSSVLRLRIGNKDPGDLAQANVVTATV